MVNSPQIATYNPVNTYYNTAKTSNVFAQNNVNGSQSFTRKTNSPVFDQFSVTQQLVNRRHAEKLKLDGNDFRLQGKYQKAIELYKESLRYDPNYTDVLYNLGRTYRDTGDLDSAIVTFKKLLAIQPKDYESRTLLGEFYEEKGNLEEAIKEYKSVIDTEPLYDYARRNYYSVRVKRIALTRADKAEQITQEAAKRNLDMALQLIQDNAPDYIKTNLEGLTIAFGLTEEVNKYENLAQYENSNLRILVSNKLIFAHPAVIATYLVHEAVHAGDRDPITSVREEQDAFQEMTKFWMNIHNGLIDPDLTLAMNLYMIQPGKLDDKVADLYIRRDPNIRMVSPNHGELPEKPGLMDNLYDSLRSMLPAQGLQANNNQVRNTPFANTQYPYQNYGYVNARNPFITSTPQRFVYQPQYVSNPFAASQPVQMIPSPAIRYVPANLGLTDNR